MDSKANIQHNKHMQLENSMVMYGVYNAETLKKLITTFHNIHKPLPHMKDYLQGNIVLLY